MNRNEYRTIAKDLLNQTEDKIVIGGLNNYWDYVELLSAALDPDYYVREPCAKQGIESLIW